MSVAADVLSAEGEHEPPAKKASEPKGRK